jgi:hypothetical protein
MSSSDDSVSGRRFLAWFLAAATAAMLALAAIAWVTDPFGLLRERAFAAWTCTPGLRSDDERYVKPLLARVYQPRTILLGSSRAVWGFDPGSFQRESQGRTANLALSAASFTEIDRLARQAVRDAPVERAWIGLDFGAFAFSEPPRRDLTSPWPIRDSRATALRYGLLDPHALKAGLAVLTDLRACADPPFDGLGFARARGPYGSIAPAPPVLRDAGTRARMVRQWREDSGVEAGAYRERLQRLGTLIDALRSEGTETILYLSPSHSSYHAMVDAAGLAGRYRLWRADMAAIARRHGVLLVESDSPAFLRTVPVPGCSAPLEDCLFYDSTHFRPILGDAIVRAALAMRQPSRGP